MGRGKDMRMENGRRGSRVEGRGYVNARFWLSSLVFRLSTGCLGISRLSTLVARLSTGARNLKVAATRRFAAVKGFGFARWRFGLLRHARIN